LLWVFRIHVLTGHQVAISVPDAAAAVDWYRETFRYEISCQDESRAMLDFSNIQLALVIPEQHPPHLGFTSQKTR
jgi:hypothetical protein